MDTFFVLLITTAISLLAGSACVTPLVSKGPRAMKFGAYVSVLLSMFIFAISFLIAEDSDAGLWASLSAFLCCATAFGITAVARQEIEKVFTLVPKVVDVVAKEFAAFDVDDDKVISIADLDRILKGEAKLPAGCDHAFVTHVKSQLSTIGHGIGKYTNEAKKTTATVVVISPRDLESYPTRVAARFSAWLTEDHEGLKKAASLDADQHQ